MRFWITLVLLAMAGCGADDGPPSTGLPDAGPADCPPGTMPLEGGGCQPAGVPPGVTAGLPPDMPCPPGTMPLDGGGCQPAGVPPEACGQGFEPDGQGGCNPILPEGPCPRGQMAIPGDTQCHEVAPCGTGDYGMIPVEATTQFVNGAYPGNDSDGTQAKPWKRIQDGIDHARSGAIVAVAAGSYTEDLRIQGKPVRVWGRCPALVEVAGTGAEVATFELLGERASRSEVRGLASTGPGIGIFTSGASEVVVDHVWLHDTLGAGLEMTNSLGPSGITVSGSLIEATTDVGVFVVGSDATIEATVVRAIHPSSDFSDLGRGIQVQRNPDTDAHATLALRGSLLEHNHDVGVLVSGSDATIEATVVRDTQLNGDGTYGDGIAIQGDPITRERASLTLHTSLLERNHYRGVLVEGSDATIEATVVRDTQPVRDGTRGRGIDIQEVPTTHERSTLALRASLLERNHNVGLFVQGSDATIEATIVRDTHPDSEGRGRGIESIGLDDPSIPHKHTTLVLRDSLVEQNHDAGVIAQSADVTIETSVVRDTQPGGDGTGGHGIVVADYGIASPDIPPARDHAILTLRASLLEQNHEFGVLVQGSDATIEATVVRDTQPSSDGQLGRGIEIRSYGLQHLSTLTLRTTLLEQNHEVGLLVSGADATIEATVVRATQPRSDGNGGDGIAVSSGDTPTTVTIISTDVEANARAGISNFSAAVVLVSSTVQCNRIDLDGEDYVEGQPFSFDGSKGNLCGCGDEPEPTCPVRSANLTLPDPIPPIQQ